jgi:dihydropteroate synthase
MGVLNVTPDSFSDGGTYSAPDHAVARALEMVEEGAAIIDVGPESTRPGAEPVSTSEQIDRAVPVIEAIRARNDRVALSIDTQVASVADAALRAGADVVNDISALRGDSNMAEVVASSGAAIVLMHMRGTPTDMQVGGGPRYDDVVSEIAAFLQRRAEYAQRCGIDASRIILDPGIGFGKRVEHNLAILRHLDRLLALGYPVLIGASRKSFIGHVLQIEEPLQRLFGSLACASIAAMAGVSILRVHDVRATMEVVRLCTAVANAETE